MINLQTGIKDVNIPRALDKAITKNISPISYLIIPNFLLKEECDNFVNYVEKSHLLVPGRNRDDEITSNRYSNVAFLERTKDNSWLFEKLITTIIPINEKYQRFNLTHIDRLQYATYNKNQYLDYHTDDYFDYLQLNGESRDLLLRKLSISIGLNEDYKGGEFEIQNFKGSPNEPYDIKKFRLAKGDAIVFPSFQVHKVHTVTDGIRKSVVAWFFGPKWC